MASSILTIHHITPELRKIEKVVDEIRSGAVILYPSDTGFMLGCGLENRDAISRIRNIRGLPEGKQMTFLCQSLSNVAEFAKVSNTAYKTIKRLIPGPYTFILPASKLVPKFAQDPKRKTSGIRVPENILSQLLLKTLGSPIISISAKNPEGGYYTDYEALLNYYSPMVDVAVRSDEYNFVGESTVIDMTTDEFEITREGAGIERITDIMQEETEE